MPQLNDCFTWKNATFALAGLMMAGFSYIAWAESQYANADDIKDIKDIITKCLIEKRC